jgi:hypothetical protein
MTRRKQPEYQWQAYHSHILNTNPILYQGLSVIWTPFRAAECEITPRKPLFVKRNQAVRCPAGAPAADAID